MRAGTGLSGPLAVPLAVGAAGALVTLLAGCGVQTTGVNVAATQPITPSQTPPQTATPTSEGKYTYTLYFVTGTDALTPVVRHSQKPLTDEEILEKLGLGPTPQESQQGYISRMPGDITSPQIAPTGKQAQQYLVQLPADAFTNLALGQITCTLSTYWQPLNPANPSVQLVFPDLPVGTAASQWRDCASFGGTDASDGAVGTASASPGSLAKGFPVPTAPATTAGG